MIKIYGSILCKDCVQCREELNAAGIAYEYLDFADDLRNLKEFLAIRDSSSLFEKVRENGSIGIPCILRADGSVILDWEELM